MRVKPSPCFSEERFWSPVVCLKKKDIYWVSLTYPLTCKLYIKFTLLKVKPSPCLSKERLWSPSGPCFICWVSLTCSLIMQRFFLHHCFLSAQGNSEQKTDPESFQTTSPTGVKTVLKSGRQ